MAGDVVVKREVARLTAVFGRGEWTKERLGEWCAALNDVGEFELIHAVTRWIKEQDRIPPGPGAIWRMVEQARQSNQPTPGGTSPVEAEYIGGERVYRCYQCLDTGWVDGVTERDGLRRLQMFPCRRQGCAAGAAAPRGDRPWPADVKILKVCDALRGVFSDPDDLLGYRREAMAGREQPAAR